jgi:TonB family protein
MSFKKTLILSVLLHLCFFAAVLFLSADLLGRYDSIPRDSSKLLNEKVLIVKLAEEISKPGEGRFIVKTNLTTEKNSVSVKTDAPIENLVNIQPSKALENYHPPLTPPIKGGEIDGALPVKGEKTVEKLPSDRKGLSQIPSPLAGEGKGEGGSEDNDTHISDGRETVVNIAYTSFSSENKGISRDNKGALQSEVIKIIRDSIERAKTYPLLARKRGIEGSVYISFKVSPQGKPQNLKIIKGSGSDILDTATLDIIKKAAPFPYVDSIIEVPVVFRLD